MVYLYLAAYTASAAAVLAAGGLGARYGSASMSSRAGLRRPV
jgi:hypothetical protein